MQATPAGFDEAIKTRQTLSVDTIATISGVERPLTGAFGIGQQVTIRRELRGELPETASLIEGAEQTTATIDADGRMPNAPHPLVAVDQNAWLNAPLKIAAGYNGITLPLFSGTIREFGFREGTRELTFDCRDASEKLAASARVPLAGSVARRSEVGRPTQHSVNTLAVIASVLHSNGIRMTPPPRTGIAYSVPGVGGWLADTGWVIPSGPAGTTSLEAGRFSFAPRTGEVVVGYPDRSINYTTGANLSLELFYRHTNNAVREQLAGVVLGDDGALWFDITGNTVQVRVRKTFAASTVIAQAAIATGWHHICAEVNYGSSVKLWIDGALVASSTAAWGANAPLPGYVGAVQFSSGRVQGVMLHHAYGPLTAPAAAVNTFTPEADLDAGMLYLEVVPNVDGRSSWEVLKEIAQAELGMVGFNERGRFFFRNQTTLASSTTPVADWPFDYAGDVGGSVAVDGIRSKATLTVKRPALVEAGRGAETEATTAVPSYLSNTATIIPPGKSTALLTGDKPWLPTQQRVDLITLPGGAWESRLGMVLCTDPNGDTRYTGSAIAAWVTPINQTTWQINFENNSGSTLFAVWPKAWSSESGYETTPFDLDKGSPAIWANGLIAQTSEADLVLEQVDAATQAQWGERVLDMGSSVWRHNPATLPNFLATVLSSLNRPRAQLEDVSLPADPRYQIGDCVRLTDPDGILPPVLARIIRSSVTLSIDGEGGMQGKYGVRQI